MSEVFRFCPSGNMRVIWLGGAVHLHWAGIRGNRMGQAEHDTRDRWLIWHKLNQNINPENKAIIIFIMRLSREIIRLFVLFSVLAGGWMCRVCCFLNFVYFYFVWTKTLTCHLNLNVVYLQNGLNCLWHKMVLGSDLNWPFSRPKYVRVRHLCYIL